jgi:glyoxylase-like metal-dependent hydrolase (beta-lactamase superfamily II)
VSGEVFAVASPVGSFYLLARGGAVILIDTGFSPLLALAGLRRLGLEPRAVTHVFLTHSDGDHTGGLGLFPDAELFLSAHEQAVLDGTVLRRILFLRRRNRLSRPYTALEDGAALTAGPFRVRAIWTPGHTPGSTCYLVDEEALFSGDLLVLRRGLARPGPRLLSNDAEENLRSLHKLGRRVPRARLLCTGHGGFSLDYRQAMAAWLPAAEQAGP